MMSAVVRGRAEMDLSKLRCVRFTAFLSLCLGRIKSNQGFFTSAHRLLCFASAPSCFHEPVVRPAEG